MLSETDKKQAQIRLVVEEIKDLIKEHPPEALNYLEVIYREKIIEKAAGLPPAWDSQISLWIENYFNAFTKYNRSDLEKTIKQLRAEKSPPKKKAEERPERMPKAKIHNYFELFEEVLNEPRRDLFSENLMTNISGLWVPALDQLERVRSRAAVIEESGLMKFNQSLIKPHFFEYQHGKELELLVDIPDWDGRDRLREIAESIDLDQAAEIQGETHVFTSELFYQFLCDWFAKVFLRLEDPMVQNRILILTGKQELGKDYLVDTLVGGLGQFAVNMNVIGENKDTWMKLHEGLVCKIAEFDKSARTEVSILKDLITTPSTNIRAPYDKAARIRYSRSSFISSCNIADILRDYTGNRRYLIFEVSAIRRGYETGRDAQAQILAQGRALAASGFKASAEAEALMRAYIDDRTPTDPAQELKELFDQLVKEHIEKAHTLDEQIEIQQAGFISAAEALPVISEIRRLTGQTLRQVQMKLKGVGVGGRGKDRSGKWGRGFSIDFENGFQDYSGDETAVIDSDTEKVEKENELVQNSAIVSDPCHFFW